MSSHYKLLLLSSLAAATLCASQAFAQAAVGEAVNTADVAADSTVDELLVTARRQSERAQDVPIPLSVISGDNLERTGAYTLADVQNQVPSLVAYNSNPRNSSVGIRGIGVSSASDGLDTSVGVYIDGVYLGRPGMALADLIDIDQFEVLRGPQGTLFGRNTSAGVLNITTRKPSFTFSGTAEASIGDYAYNQQRLSLTGPLIDGLLAARFTAFNTHRDGVLDNPKTGTKANSVGRSGARLQFLVTPTDKISIRLIGEYSIEDDTCCVSVLKQVLPGSIGATTQRTLATFAALGYVPQGGNNFSLNNSPQNMKTDQKAFSAEVNWDLGWADLTSVTAWRYWHFDPLQDSDGTPLDIIQVNVAKTKDWQGSQEFRLASKPGRFNWQAGAYFFRQKLKDHFILNQFGSDASAFYTTYLRTANPAAAAVNIATGSQYIGDTRADTDSAAVFGQANYELTDKLTLTGGIRYTHDKRQGISDTSTIGTPYVTTSIPFHYDVEVKGGNTSWLASAAYKITPDALAYVSYSTGYKAAGLNLNSAVTAGSPLVLEPEDVKNWEAGLKLTLLDHRATLNLSAFRNDLSGLQANISPSNGARSYLANVGDVRSQGFELEGTFQPIQALLLSLNGSYNDAKYKSYPNAPCPVGVAAPCDLSGKPLFQAPKWVANASAQYNFDLGQAARGYAGVQYTYRSGVFGSVDDSPFTWISSYSLVNARVGAKFGQDDRYDLSFWVNNAFDKRYFQNLGTASVVGAAVYGVSGQLGTPRTAGATLRATF
jgi:iron complex outermembrane receptor protein